jgi:GTP-binding protein
VKALRKGLDDKLPALRGAPVVLVSALAGWGLDELIEAALGAGRTWNRRIPTGELNRWFAGITERHPPPAVSGRRVRLRYITQASSRPPTFVVFTTRPDAIGESYRRYIVNELRAAFGLGGVPIRIHLRKGTKEG